MKFAQKQLIRKQLDAVLANNVHVADFIRNLQQKHAFDDAEQQTADLCIAHLQKLNDNLQRIVK